MTTLPASWKKDWRILINTRLYLHSGEKYKLRLQILEQARVDFREGKEWYKSRQVKGLSARFNRAVLYAIARIQGNPFAFAIRYRNVRICHTEAFPYALHFIIDEDAAQITIIAIIRENRDPELTIRRSAEE